MRRLILLIVLTCFAIALFVFHDRAPAYAQYSPPSGGGGGATGPTGPTGPTATGGTVLSVTSSRSQQSGDCGNFLSANGTSVTLTLTNPPTSSTCQFGVQNLSATTVTLGKNSLLINGLAQDYTIAAAVGINAGAATVWTDGTNWFVTAGPPGVAGANGTNGTNAGTGITVYSGLSGISMSGATLFFPVGGGGLASTTEASVQSHIQSATTISNFGVDLSVALGTTLAVNNSAVFTWRKGGASQTLTCTITNPATACADTSHSFTTAANDIVDIQAVFTGTIAATPNFVMNVQMGQSSGGSSVTAGPPYVTISSVTYGPIFAVTAPSATGWTWVNQGTSTVTATNGSLEFAMQTNSGTDNLRCYTQALPASTGYTAIMGISSLSHAVGVAISDGTKIISLWQNGGGTITGFKFNSATSANGNYFADITNLGVLGGMLWIRFKDAAGARTTAISSDGRNWTPLDSQASASFLTETTFGICQETNVGGSFMQPSVIVDFRMTTP